jgi:hypothetical protein
MVGPEQQRNEQKQRSDDNRERFLGILTHSMRRCSIEILNSSSAVSSLRPVNELQRVSFWL